MSGTPQTIASQAVQPLRGLVPMAHVADVTRSIDFYRKLGFEVGNIFEHDGMLRWAWLHSGAAHLMIARSARPMNPDAQDVLFYLYASDVAEYREQLAAQGMRVGELEYRFYAKRGEFRIADPDGYCLLVGNSD